MRESKLSINMKKLTNELIATILLIKFLWSQNRNNLFFSRDKNYYPFHFSRINIMLSIYLLYSQTALGHETRIWQHFINAQINKPKLVAYPHEFDRNARIFCNKYKKYNTSSIACYSNYPLKSSATRRQLRVSFYPRFYQIITDIELQQIFISEDLRHSARDRYYVEPYTYNEYGPFRGRDVGKWRTDRGKKGRKKNYDPWSDPENIYTHPTEQRHDPEDPMYFISPEEYREGTQGKGIYAH